MELLKEFKLNINQNSISFHSNPELVPVWYDKTKTYFQEKEFEIQDEKKLNKKTCSKFVKQRDSSNDEGEYYVLKIFSTRRTVVQRKNNRTIFLQKHIAELERKYGITFKINNPKSLENNLRKSDKQKQNQ